MKEPKEPIKPVKNAIIDNVLSGNLDTELSVSDILSYVGDKDPKNCFLEIEKEYGYYDDVIIKVTLRHKIMESEEEYKAKVTQYVQDLDKYKADMIEYKAYLAKKQEENDKKTYERLKKKYENNSP